MTRLSTIGERIRYERERQGISRIDLSRAAGMAATTLADLEIGRSHSTTRLHALAAHLGVRAHWLETGAGPKYLGSEEVRGHYQGAAVGVSHGETAHGYVRLPHYAAEVSAGDGAMIDDDGLEVVQFLDVAQWWADEHLPRDLARVRVLTVRGDSMAPEMNHGDLLFVDTSVQSFEAAGLYVLNWNGRALVKRLAPELRSGRIAITSANPLYPPEYIDAHELDGLHIGGRVAAWWSLRRF